MWKVGKFHLNHITILESVSVCNLLETCHVVCWEWGSERIDVSDVLG